MSGLPAAIEGRPLAEFALERFTPGTFGAKTAYEHWTRYLFALNYAAERDVLDYGCGTGFGSRLLAEAARDVLALDVADAAVRYAHEHHAHPRCRFERGDALPTDVPTASRDLIVAFEVIEHLEPQDELVREFARILRPGGVLLVSTPLPRYTATLGENPYHVRELEPEEFTRLVGRHFRHRQVLVQTPVVGETLWPAETGPPRTTTTTTLRVLEYTPGENAWLPAVGRPGPEQTIVVVASDAPLPDPRGCVVSDRDGRLLEEVHAYVRQLEQERAGLTAGLEAERAHVARTMAGLEAERGRSAALGQELEAERQRAAEEATVLGAERDAVRQLLAATERTLGDVRAALRQSEGDLRQLRFDLMYLEQKVGLRWLSWAVRGAGRRVRRLVGR